MKTFYKCTTKCIKIVHGEQTVDTPRSFTHKMTRTKSCQFSEFFKIDCLIIAGDFQHKINLHKYFGNIL